MFMGCSWLELSQQYNNVIRCFQKAGFRHHTSPEVEDIDEDIPAYEQHILLMEKQVVDSPAMQEDQIMMEELEAYRERMTEDANPDDSVLGDNRDGTPSVMSARQATKSISNLEKFFIQHGMYDDATWAAAATVSAKRIAEQSLK